MSTAIPDLWPADFGAPPQPPPATILRQQGYLLGQRTQNFVIGEVESKSIAAKGEFIHTLVISAPVLGYRQAILHAKHGVSYYPAEVALYDATGRHRRRENVPTADAFMTVLRQELANPDTVALIGSLLAQSRDEQPVS